MAAARYRLAALIFLQLFFHFLSLFSDKLPVLPQSFVMPLGSNRPKMGRLELFVVEDKPYLTVNHFHASLIVAEGTFHEFPSHAK